MAQRHVRYAPKDGINRLEVKLIVMNVQLELLVCLALTSHPITSHPITSHHIISHHIISHHIT
jgi:hypothetical protein